MKVILDLGHVTFGNVSDWSAEEKNLGIEAHLPDIDEDDDGKCFWIVMSFTEPPTYPPHPSHTPYFSHTLLTHPHTLIIPHPLTHPLPPTHSFR